MIRCQACGHVDEGSPTFCSSCGTFLEWVSEVLEGDDEQSGAGLEDLPQDQARPSGEAHSEGVDIIELPEEAPAGALGARPGMAVDAVHGGAPPSGPAQAPAVRPSDALPPPDVPSTASGRVAGGPGGPPPPPPPGTDVDRPPPVLDPREWTPPRSGHHNGGRPDMAALRGMSRSQATPHRAPPSSRRRRAVEVTAPTLDGDVQPSTSPAEVTAEMGPLMPTVQRTFAPQPVHERPTRTPQPGDLICPSCAEANLANRTTCRRCGEPLMTEAEVIRLSWWRRLLARLRRRRGPRRYRAGERPALRGRDLGESRFRIMWRAVQKFFRVAFGYLVALVAILALVGTVLPQAQPIRREIVGTLESTGQRIQRFLVPQYVRVNPIDISASSELPDHPAIALVDGFTNRWWSEGVPGPGTGQVVTVTFEEPVRLSELRIRNGGVGPESQFTANPRPRGLRLVFDDGTSQDVELVDQPGPQTVGVDGPPTRVLRMRILSVYAAVGPGTDTSMTELEFVRRLS